MPILSKIVMLQAIDLADVVNQQAGAVHLALTVREGSCTLTGWLRSVVVAVHLAADLVGERRRHGGPRRQQ